jgi:hypothetical protein
MIKHQFYKGVTKMTSFSKVPFYKISFIWVLTMWPLVSIRENKKEYKRGNTKQKLSSFCWQPARNWHLSLRVPWGSESCQQSHLWAENYVLQVRKNTCCSDQHLDGSLLRHPEPEVRSSSETRILIHRNCEIINGYF